MTLWLKAASRSCSRDSWLHPLEVMRSMQDICPQRFAFLHSIHLAVLPRFPQDLRKHVLLSFFADGELHEQRRLVCAISCLRTYPRCPSIGSEPLRRQTGRSILVFCTANRRLRR